MHVQRIQLAMVLALALGLGLFVVAACTSPVRPAPTRSVAPPTSAAQLAAAQLAAPDAGNGRQQFNHAQCVACHGPQAAGGIGPALAQTSLDYDAFLTKVRTALPPKPAYTTEELSDQSVYDIYNWLHTMTVGAQVTQRPPFTLITVEPGQAELPDGKILGMSLWTGFHCSDCHGAFAQGTSEGPALAGVSFPYELERAKMRQTADMIPEHAQTYMRDTVLKRLYEWLRQGADPEGGC